MAAPDVGVTDEALLAAHVRGEHGAFAELVTRHHDRMWRTARAVLRDPDDAADAVQDALLKVFRLARSFRGEGRVSTWLHTVVTRTALDRVAARRPAAADLADRAVVATVVTDHADAWNDLAMVRAAVLALPADQRECFVRVDVLGFTYATAAADLGVSEGTVKSRRARAKVRVVAALREAGVGEGRVAGSVAG